MPLSPQPMKDMVVILPGILGSALAKDGKEIWGLSGQAIIPALLSLGGNLQQLKLPDGIGDDDPRDGIVPVRLLSTLHLLPGFWKIAGYDGLVSYLKSRFELREPTDECSGNLVLFPYDWRLSNVLSANRLRDMIVPELERWRQDSSNPNAKLIFICHSMGGLVARFFLEVLGGAELTTKLITIGTPYQGAVKALAALSNGLSKGLGPIRRDYSDLVRSLPSAYQLLPSYKCLDIGDGNLQNLGSSELPNINPVNVTHGIGFHEQIREAANDGSQYKTFAIKGISQPTAQSAMFDGEQIVLLKSYDGEDMGGDGTVPRASSHPPEWDSDAGAAMAVQCHASLQATDGVQAQIFGILTADRLSRFMAPPSKVGVELPDLVAAGEELPVRAVAEDGNSTLPLRVTCVDEDGKQTGQPVNLRSDSEGGYEAKIKDLKPGAYRVTISSAHPRRPVDPVTDLVLVWDSSVVA